MAENSAFHIRGTVKLESADAADDLRLAVYAFDRPGHTLGTTIVDEKGNFDLGLDTSRPIDVEVIVAPADSGDVNLLRKSGVFRDSFGAAEWKTVDKTSFTLNPRFIIPRPIWWWWRPLRICVDGSVRKLDLTTGATCPISHVKVEIFDVDREFCWWDYIWWNRVHLYDKYLIRAEDLSKYAIPRGPFPPDPIGPISRNPEINPGVRVALNPQPLPPGEMIQLNRQRAITGDVNTAAKTVSAQVERSLREMSFQNPAQKLEQRSGLVAEMRTLDANEALRLSDLTISSMRAPWHIFPLCFYSKQLVCETYTDCDGDFACCFEWWPFHIRYGRLRFDILPDIIIRVTQTINGVDHVIYLDPYTSTRWNVTTAHIHLTLDDPSIQCGVDCPDGVPGTQRAFIQQIGPDQVWKINKANGTYSVLPESNGAYGLNGLSVYLNYTNDLQAPATGKYYYKLSYARQITSGVTPPDSDFVAFTEPIMPNRASKYIAPFNFVPYFLGPQPSTSPAAGLFEVPDMVDFWWDSYVSGYWDTIVATQLVPGHTGTFYLRLEMYHLVGSTLTKLTSMNYIDQGGDGTGTPPAVPPIVVGDHFDMLVVLDNEPMTYNVLTPAINECGVVPWPAPDMHLYLHTIANQPNGRIHSWTLDYEKGVTSIFNGLTSDYYPSGATNVNNTFDAGPIMLADPSSPTGFIESTCAYSVRFNAYLHVRHQAYGGYIWVPEKVYALAVEHCPTCPEC